jgi:hypothetical protein
MANETALKTLDPIAKDPRVKRVFKDEFGLWLDLAPGYCSSRDHVAPSSEAAVGAHLICEESVRDLWFKYRGVKSCDCEQCARTPRDPLAAAPAKTIAGRPMIDLPSSRPSGRVSVTPQEGVTLPNEKRALKATRASRIQGEVDAIGHSGGSIHKWRCPKCGMWVREDIGKRCAACHAKEDTQLVTQENA